MGMESCSKTEGPPEKGVGWGRGGYMSIRNSNVIGKEEARERVM